MPVPKFGPQEVLVRVRANGVCATDLKIMEGLVPTVSLPHVLGHEVAGEIVEVGSDVTGLQTGDHVTVYPTRGCGACDPCRNGMENHCLEALRTGFESAGGFSEYMRVLGRNAVRISPGVLFEEAAILPDAVASVYHALVQRAKLQVGETVAVIGVGGLGIHAVQVARAIGAEVIAADISPEKLDAAKDFQAEVIDSSNGNLAGQVKERTDGRGVDVVIECVGGEVVSSVLKESARRRYRTDASCRMTRSSRRGARRSPC